MSLYRYELQYHDMQPTQIAPGKIRQYPQNLAMQSVVGRNLANSAWDVLAAKQQQGHEAMQRDEQIRMLSMQTGVPEVHLHSSVPHGHQNMVFREAMGLPPPPAGEAEQGVDAPAPAEVAHDGYTAYSSISSAMRSVRSKNSGHATITEEAVQAHQERRALQELEARARMEAAQRLTPEPASVPQPPIAREVHLPGPSDHVPHPSAVPRPSVFSGTSGAMARKRMKTTVLHPPRANKVPQPSFGLSPADELAAPDEDALIAPFVDEPAPAALSAMQAPHIDDAPEPGYMPRPDGTPDPIGVPEALAPKPEAQATASAGVLATIPEAYQGRFGPRQASFLQGLDVAGETAKRVGFVAPGAMAGGASGALVGSFAGPAGTIAGGIAGGIAGAVGGLAIPAMSPEAQDKAVTVAVGGARMAGQYNLALTQMKLQFVGGLASLLVEAASAYADRRLKAQAPVIAGLRNWMEADKPAIMDAPEFLGGHLSRIAAQAASVSEHGGQPGTR